MKTLRPLERDVIIAMEEKIAITASQLKKKLRYHHHSTLRDAIQDLTTRGLLELIPDDSDSKKKPVKLTSAGQLIKPILIDISKKEQIILKILNLAQRGELDEEKVNEEIQNLL